MFLLCIQSECFKAQGVPIEDPYQVCNENSKRERRNRRRRRRRKKERKKERRKFFLQISQVLKIYNLLQSWNSGARHLPSPFVRNFARSGNSSKFPHTIRNPPFLLLTPHQPSSLFLSSSRSLRVCSYNVFFRSLKPFCPLGRLQYTYTCSFPVDTDVCTEAYILGRARLKRDGTRAETRFGLSEKWTNPFKSAGESVQSTTGSRGVRISGQTIDRPRSEAQCKSSGYPLQSPISPSLPIPRVTVCHHVSNGLY